MFSWRPWSVASNQTLPLTHVSFGKTYGNFVHTPLLHDPVVHCTYCITTSLSQKLPAQQHTCHYINQTLEDLSHQSAISYIHATAQNLLPDHWVLKMFIRDEDNEDVKERDGRCSWNMFSSVLITAWLPWPQKCVRCTASVVPFRIRYDPLR